MVVRNGVPIEARAVAEMVTLGAAMAADDEARTSDAMIALMLMTDSFVTFEQG
jgi:hypothetical protein